MAKVFISQPMAGRTPEDIAALRNKAVESATKYVHILYGENEPVVILDNIIDLPSGKNHMWREAQCIKLLSEADVAFFPGEYYISSVGCRTEYRIACDYMTPYVITDNLDSQDEWEAHSASIHKNF